MAKNIPYQGRDRTKPFVKKLTVDRTRALWHYTLHMTQNKCHETFRGVFTKDDELQRERFVEWAIEKFFGPKAA